MDDDLEPYGIQITMKLGFLETWMFQTGWWPEFIDDAGPYITYHPSRHSYNTWYGGTLCEHRRDNYRGPQTDSQVKCDCDICLKEAE